MEPRDTVPQLTNRGSIKNPSRVPSLLPSVPRLTNRGSINNPSRVPRYQNQLKVGGFCDFQVKPLSWRGKGVWGKG